MEIKCKQRLAAQKSARFLTLVLFALCATSVSAGTWYVDNSLASSLNSGTNWVNAWTNFASISWNRIQSGDTIYLSGGVNGQTYKEVLSVVHNANSEAQRITIRCAQDTVHAGPVTIMGGIKMGDESANKASYVTVDGSYNGQINMYLIGSGSNSSGAIYHRYDSELGNHYLYLDLSNTNGGSQTQGVELSNYADGTVVAHCRLHNCQNRAIREGSSGTSAYYGRISIHDCTFTQNRNDPIGIDGAADAYNCVFDGTGSDPSTHPDGIQGVKGYWRIYNNVFHDFTQGIFIETTSTNLQNVQIYNNIFYTMGTVTMPAIIFRAKLPVNNNHTWTNILIANNDFVGLKMAAVRIFADLGITVNIYKSRLQNNIFSGNLGNTDMNAAGEGTIMWSAGEFVWNNNIFNNPQSVRYKTTTYGTVQQFQSANGDCTGNLSAAPTFRNLLEQDYRLTSASPGIDSGLSLTEFTVDFDDALRPQGPRWDIGALEYGAAIASPRNLHVVGVVP